MDKQITPKMCPVCGVDTNYLYRITEKDDVSGDWYRCACGVIFLPEPDNKIDYDEKYHSLYTDDKVKKNAIHAARVYAPIIEELTYGRMMLDVGFASGYNMDYFENRGWLTWGIDVNVPKEKRPNLYKGDFLTYDFEPRINKEELEKHVGDGRLKKRTFDLIWMSHVLEHFDNPIEVLKKAKGLLSDTGVMYISTPDIDFINKTGLPSFPHWKCKEHRVLWSSRALKRELERLGFDVILIRRNFSSRFISWYDVQCICQKRYF